MSNAFKTIRQEMKEEEDLILNETDPKKIIENLIQCIIDLYEIGEPEQDAAVIAARRLLQNFEMK